MCTSLTPDFKNSLAEGLAPDAPPHLEAGVLEDSTGFARLRNSLENKALRTPQADSEQGLSVPLPI